MQLKAILLALVLSIFATTSGADAMEQETLRKFLDPIQYAAVDISPRDRALVPGAREVEDLGRGARVPHEVGERGIDDAHAGRDCIE